VLSKIHWVLIFLQNMFYFILFDKTYIKNADCTWNFTTYKHNTMVDIVDLFHCSKIIGNKQTNIDINNWSNVIDFDNLIAKYWISISRSKNTRYRQIRRRLPYSDKFIEKQDIDKLIELCTKLSMILTLV
jgi:hypothetical protein